MNNEKVSERKILPPADIFETKDKFVIVLDMPGANKDSIELSSEDNTLLVTAKTLETDKEWKPVITEFELADYRREFSLGTQVNRDAIEARYENGILTIELEKAEKAKPRKIEVKAA